MGRSRRRAGALLAAGALALAGSTALALAGVAFFPTWHYVFAWAAVLVAADALVALRSGESLLFGRPAFLATLLLWSAPFWFVFELLNFRLDNWFYVYLPDGRVERWAGTVLGYATVFPAVLLAERALDAFGGARGAGIPRLRVTPRLRRWLQAVGLAMIVAALAWPRGFFPLVWGGVALLADPFVHRRDPSRSLLGDLERGRAGRPVRLLLGGLAIGLVWESLNWAARGRWIYTVPGFEEGKVFEMPLAGLLGFPPFALEAFAAWQALVVVGLAVPRAGPARRAPGWARAAAAIGAAAFSALVLVGMERETVASTTPRVAELPGVPPAAARAIEAAGWDAFALAERSPVEVAARVGVAEADAAAWVDAARLATLRGIGDEGARALAAVGVRSVADLARQDPAALARRLADASPPVPAARIRIWIRAARES